MSDIKTLFKQSSHYFVGRLLIMAAGFVSFPILTRILPVAEYGILSLVSTSLLMLTALSKLGLQESAVRFYAEFKAKDLLGEFFGASLMTSVGASIAISGLFLIFVQFLPSSFLDEQTRSLLSISSVLIFLATVTGTVISFVRAEQRTGLYNGITVINRYGSLVLGICLLFFVIGGLLGYFVGQIIAGSALLAWLLYHYRGQIRVRRVHIMRDMMKEPLHFGFPLVWNELGALVLNYVDRYFIQAYIGAMALGFYTAGYNLANYVSEAVFSPINYAMTPIFMKILVDKGEEETRHFFTKTFRYFLLIALPVTLGFIAVGDSLIIALSSEKYAEAAKVLPYIVVGQLFHGSTLILNSGLFIRKMTRVVTVITIGSGIVNIGLNFVLVPQFGILGAAYATVLSYVGYAVVITYYSFREFSFPIDYRHGLLYLGASVTMCLAAMTVHIDGQWSNILAKVGVGVVTYSLLVIVFDRDLRGMALQIALKETVE